MKGKKPGGGIASKAALVGANRVIGPGWGEVIMIYAMLVGGRFQGFEHKIAMVVNLH